MWYLDTSAAVKLVVDERHSAELSRWVGAKAASIASSDLLRTELLRAVRRGAPNAMRQARQLLDSVTLLTITTDVFEHAAELGPESMRSLDALHLAAALTLGDDLDGIVTYDERLADATRVHGVAVMAPGRSEEPT